MDEERLYDLVSDLVESLERETDNHNFLLAIEDAIEHLKIELAAARAFERE